MSDTALQKPETPETRAGLPFVSVILPVRNEGASFASTLEAVRDQDYPADRMEILVVDGMSEDQTREVVRSFASRDTRFRLVDNPGRIVPHAMNRGIAEARGSYVVRIDGHTRVAQDFVSRSVAALRASGAECVGGRMDPVGATYVQDLVALATSGPFGVGDSHFHYSREPRFTDSVYLGSWPRETLMRLGGFDEEMVRDQDDELNYRLRAAGGRVWLDPSIRSTYTPRGSLRRLFKQYYQYGYWKVRVFQKHPGKMRLRHFVPAAFVGAGALSVAAASSFVWGRWLLVAWGGSYVLAALAAAVRSSRRPSRILGLPAVFFVIHAAYGTGFLAGLVRFLPRWLDGRAAKKDLRSAGVEQLGGTPK